jgi:hypothetical protein
LLLPSRLQRLVPLEKKKCARIVQFLVVAVTVAVTDVVVIAAVIDVAAVAATSVAAAAVDRSYDND